MDRRFYCRLGFLLLCVLPTLAVASMVAWRKAPVWFVGSKSGWESHLSATLGFRVKLEKVSRPHSGTTLLQGIELADRETGRIVARARIVEAAHTRQGLVLVVSQPEILVDELESLAGTFHDTLLRVPEATATSVHLVAGEVTFRSPRESQTFTGVECLLETMPEGPQATLRFRLPDEESREPAQLRVTRRRTSPTPSTRWELHTGAAPLPCALLAAYVPSLAMLGEECEFHGVIWGEETASGWQGDVSGSLVKVNLDQLVTQQFPHKLSGTANVTFNRARIRNGRLVDAAGLLEGRGGTIGRSLVEASAQSLEFTAADRVQNVKRWPIRYERLGVGFTLSESGLSLSGSCDSAGTVLADGEGSLVSIKPRHSVPVVSLVRALVPESKVQVPATAETDALLRALPIPPLAQPAEKTARLPGARVRLKASDRALE